MTVEEIGAFIHATAPHTASALYLCDAGSALAAVLYVSILTWIKGTAKFLHHDGLIIVATVAAPFPTWCLFLLVTLDPDLSKIILADAVSVGFAGVLGIASIFSSIARVLKEASLRKNECQRIINDNSITTEVSS